MCTALYTDIVVDATNGPPPAFFMFVIIFHLAPHMMFASDLCALKKDGGKTMSAVSNLKCNRLPLPTTPIFVCTCLAAPAVALLSCCASRRRRKNLALTIILLLEFNFR